MWHRHDKVTNPGRRQRAQRIQARDKAGDFPGGLVSDRLDDHLRVVRFDVFRDGGDCARVHFARVQQGFQLRVFRQASCSAYAPHSGSFRPLQMLRAVIEHRAVAELQVELVALDVVKIDEQAQREFAILRYDLIGFGENFASRTSGLEHEHTSSGIA
ncbi:MAG TPA: hypothetical protein VJS69_00315 [Candidatus Krumholzibacteria bacterium]|nr:hypothetical protein [Candidatus Krumholzibacteria bacterium]